ncbi:serine/threonine-protein kinase [Hoyosella subflava]|uniref:Protein kinase n=1 Tax=Hoyosella subflava (strain DSM 45089 / JCM 17490 / NBRC 109087 / DQS3-9A1) TaxID=443218 RepID=F6EPR1_HOYSD|nr:serine/threonine-protein kinase [Hoyosella subflava]AEF40540.1 Protein kinase [Hoyosella subflava DQS3-9A1]
MAEEGDTPTPGGSGPGIADELSAAGFINARMVGRGGFGTVYRCVQAAVGRVVAVKVLSSDLDRDNRERFLREGHAMGRLSGHPNIVNIIQVGATDSGRPYIVMPFHPRDSLAVRLRRHGPIAWSTAISIGVKLAGALETAHRCGTLHRDVKPGNILMSDYDEPRLTDFGIARIEGGFETATAAFTGSLAYTAPEVLEGHKPTRAADIYALGATLFALITGKAAHERRTGEELVAQFVRITTQPLPDLRERGIPDDICAAIEKSMALRIDDRWQSAEELGHELQAAQERHGLPVDDMAIPEFDADDLDTASAAWPADGAADFEETEASPRAPDFTAPSEVRPPTGESREAQPPSIPVAPLPPVANPAIPVTPEPSPGPPDTPPSRRNSRVLTYAAITLVPILVIAVGWALWPRTSPATCTQPPYSAEECTFETVADSWSPYPDAPLARQQTATAVDDGGIVWVIGGLDENGASTDAVRGYDPGGGRQWRTGLSLSEPVDHAAAVFYNGELVVIGGWLDGGSTTTGQVLALRDGRRWVELPPLNHPRAAAAAAVAAGKIVVFGGQSDGELVPETEVFDGERWVDAAAIPVPREHLAATTDGSFVYAVGGRQLSVDDNSAALDRYDPVADTWTSLPDMPTPRGGLGAAFADGRILAVGGELPDRVSGVTESYDIAAQTWSQLPEMRTPRHGMSVAAVRGEMYAIGGANQIGHRGTTNATETLRIPAPRTDPDWWVETARSNTPRQWAAAAVVDELLWVAGGIDDRGSTTLVEAFDPSGRPPDWRRGIAPPLPIDLNHAMAVSYRGELFVIGGWSAEGGDTSAIVSDRVFALRDGQWTEVASLNHPRAAAAAAVVGNRIVVFGGQADGELVGPTEVFDGSEWTVAGEIPTPREHLAGASDGTYAYAIGGRTLTVDNNSAAVERFDPATGEWAFMPSMPEARGGVAATYVPTAAREGYIVVAGGEESAHVLSIVYALNPATGAWTQLPDLQIGRHGIALATIGDTVYAIGGATRPGHTASTNAAETLRFG